MMHLSENMGFKNLAKAIFSGMQWGPPAKAGGNLAGGNLAGSNAAGEGQFRPCESPTASEYGQCQENELPTALAVGLQCN